MNVVILIRKDGKKLMAIVPEYVYLVQGDPVRCKVNSYEMEAYCMTDNFDISEDEKDLVAVIISGSIDSDFLDAKVVAFYDEDGKAVRMDTTEKDRRYIAMLNGEKVPCTLCRYAPPNIDTDKPCRYCPAQGQEKEKE